MQNKILIELVEKIQNYNCEFQDVEIKAAKKGTPTRLYDTLSSFSNQDGGGTIVFGLDEKQNFAIVGVYDVQDLQHKVAEQCKQMEPPVRPLFSVVEIKEKMVVAAEIPGVDIADRPTYYRGVGRVKGSYIRVGESDEPMSDYEIYSYDAYHRRVRDDLRVADMADIGVLDQVLLERYIMDIKVNKPNIARLSDEEILNLMGITKEGKPTLTGVMCFSAYPQAAFPQLCITAVVVPGTHMGEVGEEGERFISNKRIEGTVSEMLDEAVLFVKRNMNEKTIIDDMGKRQDKLEYPIKAVREAILNALMHRDYSIHTEGSPVRIVMFKDRLEITNVGGLYGRLTLDSLGNVHADTRNQTLTATLERKKTAENRHSGIPTIRYEMKKMGLPKPEFMNHRGNFTVVLRNDTYGKYDPMSGKYVDEVREDSAVYGGKGRSLSERIVEFCRYPRSRAELAEFIGRTQYYAMVKDVMPLVECGVLQMTIPDKPKSKTQQYIATKYKKSLEIS